jgi:hypothetical protein
MTIDANRIRLLVIGASFFAFFAAALPARSQEAAYMSCEELWFKRNEIYARNGYCFETDRARAVFGDGCFPPYGRLSGWEKRRVQELQRWERRKGC